MRARVLRRLAPEARLSDVQIVVHVGDAAPRLEVSRGGQRIAERRFENFPTRCNARRDAIAVAVALAVERAHEAPAAATSADAPGTTQATSAEGQASTVSAAATAPSNASDGAASAPSAHARAVGDAPQDEPADDGSDERVLTPGMHAGVALLLEVLPAAAFVGVLGADAVLGSSSVRVSLSGLFSLTQRDDVLGAAIESRVLLGRLLVCTDLAALDDFGVEGCGGVLAGAVFAAGRGYQSDRSTELAYAGLLARAGLRFPAKGWLSARLFVDGLVPIVRPAYVLREAATDDTTAVTPAPLGAALGLEIVLTLP